MSVQDSTAPVVELARQSPFELRAAAVPGPIGELLRAIARAEADGRQHGMPGAEQWRWSNPVVLAKKLARDLSGVQR